MPDAPRVPDPLGQVAEGTPAEGGDKSFDVNRAYEEIRPAYTRATQDLSEAQGTISQYEELFEALHDPDPEVQAAAYDFLGLEPVTATPETPAGGGNEELWTDPLETEVERLRGAVDTLTSAREADEAAEQDAETRDLRNDFIGESISLIEEALTPEGAEAFRFDENEETAIGNLAIAMEDSDGVPDVRAAYELLFGNTGVLEANRQRWIDTKTSAPQAPLGRSIPAVQKPQSAEQRINYVDQRWADLTNQQ